MSGVAAVGGLEATIGLVPRYLRSRNAEAPIVIEAPPPPPPIEEPDLPGMRGNSVTDELRRRIAEAATPEKRAFRPIWIVLGVVLTVAMLGVMFPEAFAAMLPDVGPSF